MAIVSLSVVLGREVLHRHPKS